MKDKKYIITIVLLLIFLFILGSLYLKKDTIKTITFYQTFCNFDDLKNGASVQIGDLKIQLTDFFLNAQYQDNLENVLDVEKEPHSCSQRLKFSNSNTIQAVIYDYLIYDNHGNILATNLLTIIKGKKEQNEFLKYINKTRFNSTDMQAYSNRIIGNSVTNTIVSTDSMVSDFLISSIVGIKEDGEYNNDFEQIHILIINPKYQEYGNKEYIEFNDTVVEFILKK